MAELDTPKETPSPDQGQQPAKPADAKVCANCGTALSGPFCHQCGQPSKSIIRFFGSLLSELFEDIIRLDSRGLRSLYALMFKPGFLTKEYVRGRRFHYVTPLRLFLFSSILCFFVLWLVNVVSNTELLTIKDETDGSTVQFTDKMRSALFEDRPELQAKLNKDDFSKLSEDEKKQVIERIEQANEKLKKMGMPLIKLDKSLTGGSEEAKTPTPEEKEADKVALTKPDETVSGVVEGEVTTGADTKDAKAKDASKDSDGEANIKIKLDWLSDEEKKQLETKLKNWVLKIKADPRDFISDMLELIPKTMLFLLPIFALFMRLAYPFANRFYIEHMIHAIHGHAFLFLSIMMAVLFELVGDGLANSQGFFLGAIRMLAKVMEVLTLLWIPLYFLLSLRNVYQQGWLLTIFKWLLLGTIYSTLFGIGTIVVVLSSALLS